VLGTPQGSLPFFAGWRGTPTVDRTDGPNIAYHMVSPDNSEAIITVGKPVNTTSPATAGVAKFRPNTIVTMYPSAAEMLTRYIVPQLGFQGHLSAPEPIDNESTRNLRQQAASQGVFVDLAGIHITGIPNVGDAYVSATSFVTSHGQRTEGSQTLVRIFTAPAGRVDSLVAAFRALPAIQMNPDWIQRQQARDQQAQQQLNATMQQGNNNQQTFDAINRSNAAIAQHHAQTNAAINAMHSQTQQNIQNSNTDYAQRQQQSISDTGALQNSVTRNDNVSYKWCNAASGEVQWIWNSTLPPAGTGWSRCQ
jgi:hypothetical protein